MKIKGVTIGNGNRKAETIGLSIKDKAFIKLIDSGDLAAMSELDLMVIIEQGVLQQSAAVKELLCSEAFSDDRRVILEKIKNGNANYEEASIDNIPEVSDHKNIKLSKLNIIDQLKSIDNPLINAIPDKAAIDILIQARLKLLWNAVFNDEMTYNEIISEFDNGGKLFKEIINIFKTEYQAISTWKTPIGYDAHKLDSNGHKICINPNNMQKLIVHRLNNHKYYGNWSDTGTGKTLSAILASREVDSHLTVIVVIDYDTANQWKNDIYNAFPASTGTMVYTQVDYHRISFDKSKYNYVIIPYSRFSQANEDVKLNMLANNKIDFIIIDEVHFAKNRGKEEDQSARRKRILKLNRWAEENNSNLYRMVMSATPVINDLTEAKSILTLLTSNNYDNVQTKCSLTNAIKLHQLLTSNGLRFISKYNKSINIHTGETDNKLKIDGSPFINNIWDYKYIDFETLFINHKLNACKSYIQSGTLIYSHYVKNGNVINSIKDFVELLGFTVGVYSGYNSSDRENDLSLFKQGKIDVLIASDPITTGVDGIQYVCNKMIIVTLPWTNAEFKQLIGRIHRQGMKFNHVDIYIPQIVIDNKIINWSWDKQRFDLIESKRTLADCVIDGIIPTDKKFPKRETLYKQSIEALKIWQNRIKLNNTIESSISNVDTEISKSNIEYKKSIISSFNNRGACTKHSKFNEYIVSNPEKFFEYHKLRRESMHLWDEIPYEYIATKIKNKNRVVADFGCGENKLKTIIKNEVYSFDHIAFDDSVIACDMANTPLENETIDIAVFSLALWGPDYSDYFKEAYRVLNYDGTIYIAEPVSKYTEEERNNLISTLSEYGFNIIMHNNKLYENRGKFFYITAIKQ